MMTEHSTPAVKEPVKTPEQKRKEKLDKLREDKMKEIESHSAKIKEALDIYEVEANVPADNEYWTSLATVKKLTNELKDLPK